MKTSITFTESVGGTLTCGTFISQLLTWAIILQLQYPDVQMYVVESIITTALNISTKHVLCK